MRSSRLSCPEPPVIDGRSEDLRQGIGHPEDTHLPDLVQASSGTCTAQALLGLPCELIHQPGGAAPTT
jgi:hypothetical protein